MRVMGTVTITMVMTLKMRIMNKIITTEKRNKYKDIENENKREDQYKFYVGRARTRAKTKSWIDLKT